MYFISGFLVLKIFVNTISVFPLLKGHFLSNVVCCKQLVLYNDADYGPVLLVLHYTTYNYDI